MQSRYYNPEWGRFINADGITGVTGELLSHNMFAYCANDPVNLTDSTGFHPKLDQERGILADGLFKESSRLARWLKGLTGKRFSITKATGNSSKVPAQLIRGQAFEKVVLNEQGIPKNNTTKFGRSIPDGYSNGRITEIKDVKYIYKSKQFRDYINSGKPIDLIVSPQSKVSQPLQDAIKNGGGSIMIRQANGTYTIY